MFPKIVVPPKSSILIGFSINFHHPFWGLKPPIFGNTLICLTQGWKTTLKTVVFSTPFFLGERCWGLVWLSPKLLERDVRCGAGGHIGLFGRSANRSVTGRNFRAEHPPGFFTRKHGKTGDFREVLEKSWTQKFFACFLGGMFYFPWRAKEILMNVDVCGGTKDEGLSLGWLKVKGIAGLFVGK